jgi:hypothetical protein
MLRTSIKSGACILQLLHNSFHLTSSAFNQVFDIACILTYSSTGNVRVPEELKFPHACCVGIASQTHLSILNPTDRWLQVTIGVLSVSVNGEKVSFVCLSIGLHNCIMAECLTCLSLF